MILETEAQGIPGGEHRSFFNLSGVTTATGGGGGGTLKFSQVLPQRSEPALAAPDGQPQPAGLSSQHLAFPRHPQRENPATRSDHCVRNQRCELFFFFENASDF